MSEYVSSIINKYGDNANVKKDSETVKDILDRQGMSFITDCLANYIGARVLRCQYTTKEVALLKKSILTDLDDAINERT